MSAQEAQQLQNHVQSTFGKNLKVKLEKDISYFYSKSNTKLVALYRKVCEKSKSSTNGWVVTIKSPSFFRSKPIIDVWFPVEGKITAFVHDESNDELSNALNEYFHANNVNVEQMKIK